MTCRFLIRDIYKGLLSFYFIAQHIFFVSQTYRFDNIFHWKNDFKKLVFETKFLISVKAVTFICLAIILKMLPLFRSQVLNPGFVDTERVYRECLCRWSAVVQKSTIHLRFIWIFRVMQILLSNFMGPLSIKG